MNPITQTVAIVITGLAMGITVQVGQKIGEFRGLGAPIHASVSGTVKAVEPRPYSMGGNMTSVVIENDFQDELSEEVKAPADPNALSVEEMATFLGISRVGVYNLCHAKGFPSIRIGKRILIPRDRFLAWLNELPEVSNG